VVWVAGLIFAGRYFTVYLCVQFQAGDFFYTLDSSTYITLDYYGSFLNTSGGVDIAGCGNASLGFLCGPKGATFYGICNVNGYAFRNGWRSKGAIVISMSDGYGVWQNTAGHAPTSIDSVTGVGLTAIGSQLLLGNMAISNCTSHAISLKASTATISAALEGTGNTGAGILAQQGSHVRYPVGTPPTITGTVGDLSVDGTTQVSTWAAITAGTPVADTSEMVTAKVS
jgi:hypothetical protein